MRESSSDDVNPKGLITFRGGDAPDAWPWLVDLDVMTAAPGFHVHPVHTVPVHTHRWGGVLYILATSDFVRRV